MRCVAAASAVADVFASGRCTSISGPYQPAGHAQPRHSGDPVKPPHAERPTCSYRSSARSPTGS